MVLVPKCKNRQLRLRQHESHVIEGCDESAKIIHTKKTNQRKKKKNGRMNACRWSVWARRLGLGGCACVLHVLSGGVRGSGIRAVRKAVRIVRKAR